MNQDLALGAQAMDPIDNLPGKIPKGGQGPLASGAPWHLGHQGAAWGPLPERPPASVMGITVWITGIVVGPGGAGVDHVFFSSTMPGAGQCWPGPRI